MTKYRILIVLFSIILGLGACKDDDEIVDNTIPKEDAILMNVASYNLRYYNTGDTGDKNWNNRKNRVFELMQKYKFELVGVQEIRSNQAEDIIAGLPEFTYYGKSRNNGDNGEQVGILYNSERFTEKGKGFFWLSETPDEQSIGWGASVERVCVWMRLIDKKDKKEFFFFSTHLDHQNENSRIESSKLLASKMQEIAGGKPVFCVGDFNAKPASLPIQNMKLYYADSWYKTRETPVGCATLNDFSETVRPTKRIDYIFSSDNITIYSFHTIEDMMGGEKFYPSDHFPVMAEAALK